MQRIIKRALLGVLVGGGLALLGTAAAQAAETSGDDGTASGTQALIDIAAPVTVSGNGISVLGDSSSTGPQAAPAAPKAPAAEAKTSGSHGTASGTQAVATASAPVTVSGNAVSVLGDSTSTGSSGASSAPQADAPAAAPAATTSGSHSLLGGTQGLSSVALPITVTGNGISVLGDSASTDAGMPASVAAAQSDERAPAATTDGTDGIAGGTQVVAPVTAPITVGGNAISVVGNSESRSAATGPGMPAEPSPTASTDGADSAVGGTQVAAPVDVPITVGGNAISVVGDSTFTHPGAAGDAGDADNDTGDGTEGGMTAGGASPALASLGSGTALATTGGEAPLEAVGLAVLAMVGGTLLAAIRKVVVSRI